MTIRRDEFGFVVDVQNGDGGDSANRAGLLELSGHYEPLLAYVLIDGLMTRHPYQAPWDNPWNNSRDSLIPYTAGLWKKATAEAQDAVRKIFWAHARRLFFCQNFERDWPWTTKYPWPHWYLEEGTWSDGSTGPVRKFKWFDFADPLLPNDIAHLIECGRIWWLYWFLPVGWAFLILTIIAHRWDKSDDDAQIISECVVAGPWAVKLYTLSVWDWEARLERYWSMSFRQCPEMAEMLRKLVKDRASGPAEHRPSSS